MEEGKLVQFDEDITSFFTTKEVTNEMALKHIKEDKGWNYTNLRIEDNKIVYDKNNSTIRIQYIQCYYKYV